MISVHSWLALVAASVCVFALLAVLTERLRCRRPRRRGAADDNPDMNAACLVCCRPTAKSRPHSVQPVPPPVRSSHVVHQQHQHQTGSRIRFSGEGYTKTR